MSERRQLVGLVTLLAANSLPVSSFVGVTAVSGRLLGKEKAPTAPQH